MISTRELALLIPAPAHALSVSDIVKHFNSEPGEVLKALKAASARPSGSRNWYIPQEESLDLESSQFEDEFKHRTQQIQSGQKIIQQNQFIRQAASKLDEYEAALQVKLTTIPPVTVIESKATVGRQQIPLLLLSDIHYGERVDYDQTYDQNFYDPEESQRRLEKVFDQFIQKAKNRTVRNLGTIVIWLGGDLIHGDIHDSYKEVHGNYLTPLQESQAMLEQIYRLIISIADDFDDIQIVCNAGNHGRTTAKKRSNQSNGFSYEQAMYLNLAAWIESNINLSHVRVTTSNNTCNYLEIFNKRYRFLHGDTLKFGANFVGNINKGLKAYDQYVPADFSFLGHFHTLIKTPKFIINDALVGLNTWTIDMGFDANKPSQTLVTIDSEYGVVNTESLYAHS